MKYVFEPWYFGYYAPIYIDTSALRSLPKAKWNRRPRRYFTSGLTILEMLTHYLRKPNDARAFGVAKSAFQFLQKNRIRIDWRVSEDIFNEAFPNIASKRVRTGDLSALYELILESESAELFCALLEARDLASDAREAIEYDDFIGRAFTDPNKIKLFEKNLSQAFQEGHIQPYLYKNEKVIPEDPKQFFHDMAYGKIEHGRVFILKALLGRRELQDQSPLEGYKNNLELFLSASARQVFTKALSKANYKRNDMIDIYHLAYVGIDVKLLTKETLLIDFVKEFQPRSFEPFDNYA